MSTFRKVIIVVVLLLLALHLALMFTGKTYLYKGVANTYLKGRSGPTIDEYAIFDSRKINASNPQPWPVSEFYNQHTIGDSTRQRIASYETVAFLVVSMDSLLHEEYWENYNEHTISNSFSMAKTIVSVLTGIAIREGHIRSPDQPAADFLPELKKDERSAVTIRHLLTMSSGISFDESYSSPFAYPAAAYYGKELRELTLKYPLVTEPGKTLDYQSGTTQLLGMVLEAATGTTMSEYAEQKLWRPMGAETDALWNLDEEDGTEKAYCCFIATARDFARFGKLYMDMGHWNGLQLLDTSYVTESLKPAPLKEKNGSPQNRYGYSWWLMTYKNMKVFYMRGILGQYVWAIPEKDLVVVRLGRKRAANQGDNHPVDMFVYLDEALRIQEKLH